jgi:hypothetical protein
MICARLRLESRAPTGHSGASSGHRDQRAATHRTV